MYNCVFFRCQKKTKQKPKKTKKAARPIFAKKNQRNAKKELTKNVDFAKK